jgi:hypothetical protein
MVGSVPLTDAAEVFRVAGQILGKRLRRVPDGETGARVIWFHTQHHVMASTPGIEIDESPGDPDRYNRAIQPLRVTEHGRSEGLRFGDLGYAGWASESYDVFRAIREEGLLPADCRFMVALPTPYAPVSTYFTAVDQEFVEPAYEARMIEEVGEIASVIPPEDLAIQWDTCVEFAALEGLSPCRFDDPLSSFVERLARLGNGVPPGAEVGYHLCYGDFQHRHFTEPKDAAKLVEVTNGIAEETDRQVQWIHLPVPRDRDDDAFFEPLSRLRLQPGTELYLGLAHRTDGVEGTQRRIATALRHVSRFGVSTECGLGRRPPETIPEILEVMAAVAGPHS